MGRDETASGALDLVIALCRALEDEEIRYCHWKSNEAIDRPRPATTTSTSSSTGATPTASGRCSTASASNRPVLPRRGRCRV